MIYNEYSRFIFPFSTLDRCFLRLDRPLFDPKEKKILFCPAIRLFLALASSRSRSDTTTTKTTDERRKKRSAIVRRICRFVCVQIWVERGGKEDARQTDIFTDMSGVIQYTMKRVTQT